MGAKEVLIQSSARKKLLKLPLHIHKKVLRSFEIIRQNPLIGIKLHGKLARYHKYRIGDYRIVYRLDVKPSTVIIVKLEHRQGVYK